MEYGFHGITQQSGFLGIEVSLSMNAGMLVVCFLLFIWLLLGLYILVLPMPSMRAVFSYGQEMVSVFFAIKLKNFVVILIFIR